MVQVRVFYFAAVSKGEGWELSKMTCEWQIQKSIFRPASQRRRPFLLAQERS